MASKCRCMGMKVVYSDQLAGTPKTTLYDFVTGLHTERRFLKSACRYDRVISLEYLQHVG